jgi:hypothetical protein
MAAGMVLSAAVSLIILPVMTLLRRDSGGQRLLVLVASLAIAIDVYFLTNPYVLIHLLHDRTVLLSNLRNSQAMYQSPASVEGVWNAVKLVGLGATPLIAMVAIVGVIALSRKRQALAWLLGSVSLLVLIQFVLLATGKPAEYARFALVPDIALMIAAVAGVAALPRGRDAVLGLLVLQAALYAISYDWHFAIDSTSRPTRIIAAERLQKFQQNGATTLAVTAEPAPYSLPPVDLFKWKIVLLPRGQTTSDADVTIHTNDWASKDDWSGPRLLPTPISWAHKPFRITVRQKPPP